MREMLSFGETELAEAVAGVTVQLKLDASRLTISQLVNLLEYLRSLAPKLNPVDQAFKDITVPGSETPYVKIGNG